MPDRPAPVTRGEVAELATSVGALQGEVHDLIDAMKTAVHRSIEARQIAEETARTAVTEIDAKRSRKRFIAWGLVLLLLSTLITVGVITTTVSECFLNQSHMTTVAGKKVVALGPGGGWGTVCGWIPGYSEAMHKGNQQQGQFQNLLKEIPRNARDLRRQHREIARLKRVLRQHGIVAR